MVSFFGLKFGADKRKKRVDSPQQQWNQAEEYIGRRESYFQRMASSNRPRTSQGTQGSRGLYPGDSRSSILSRSSRLSDADFKGVRAVLLGTTAAVPAGTGPVLSPTLKTFASDSNLGLTLRTGNLSSVSLNMPPRRFGDSGSEVYLRPGTAHSMRGWEEQNYLANIATTASGGPVKSPLALGGSSSPVNSDTESLLAGKGDSESPGPGLRSDLPNASTATSGDSPFTPLGQIEVTPPLRSDTESLLCDTSEAILYQNAARVLRPEDSDRSHAPEERRQGEAELAVQKHNQEAANLKLEAARLRMAYPSPPASIESEQDVPDALNVGPISNRSEPAAHLRTQLAGRSNDTTVSHSAPNSATGHWTSDLTPSSRRQGSVPTIEAPPPSPHANRRHGLTIRTSELEPREGSGPDRSLSAGSQMLQPSDTREHVRVATGLGAYPQRSPLFQQMSPFDLHSDEEEEDNEHSDDHRAPYGIPSPPLSHRQRPGEKEQDGQPILRTVGAKRDTTLVTPVRTSLGLQIDEFAKTLQQAQAMSALENGSEVSINILASPRSRGNSNSSSFYSDMSDSPVVIEPPLVSPKTFPLSPRPMGPRATPTEIAPGWPKLEVRSESPFGSYFSNFSLQTADILPSRVQTPEYAPASPVARPRPRLGAVKPVRPTLGEYGNVKVNKVATLAGRVPRPSPDEYGISLRRTESPAPMDTRSPFRADSPFNMNSPIVTDLIRQNSSSSGPDEMTDGVSSTDTSRTSSPIAVASYSVFSPPPPLKRPIAPRSARPEWFGPAPTAPPCAPLPIPEKSSALLRTDTFDMSARPSPLTTPRGPAGMDAPPKSPGLQPTPPPRSPGLQTSPVIVPQVSRSPEWPLPPGPSRFPRKSPGGESGAVGFTARRQSMNRERKRAPPAPLNIMATKYADEVGYGSGPWTPESASLGHLQPATSERSRTGHGEERPFEIRSDFSAWREEPAPYQPGDKSSAIGMARGLSIKYDKPLAEKRERERRAKGQNRTEHRSPKLKIIEEKSLQTVSGVMRSPSTPRPMAVAGELTLERLKRPNHGLRSPMGFADEQGIQFI